MSLPPDAVSSEDRDLVLCRHIEAPPAKLYRAWTEPELMKLWFCPLPWVVSHVDNDVRVGGHSLVVMRSPEGREIPNRGVYLEVVPDRRLVFTDAFTEAWVPSAKPFFTGIIEFEPEGSGTRYTATARHWTVHDRAAHEQMGFHEGWGKAADQLQALVMAL